MIPRTERGETGGNVKRASYFYDPDYHNVEFCAAMDTIDNYLGIVTVRDGKPTGAKHSRGLHRGG